MRKKDSTTFEIIKWNPYKIMSIDSRRIGECMRFYQKKKLDGVSLSPYEGFKLKDLSFLRDYPFIQGVVAPYADALDMSDLCALRELKFISVHNSKKSIDHSQFPHLEEIRVQWHSGIVLPETSTRMKRLHVGQYRPKTNDCRDLPNYVNLEDLELVMGSIRSLAGLDRFKKLRTLALHHLTKLERLAELKSASLEVLDLETCKKISDHAHVATLKNLRVLVMGRCGSIPSLDFANRMPKLEKLSFVEMNVEDGDLSPCLRLKRVGFSNKRHYSHTMDEIEAILGENSRS